MQLIDFLRGLQTTVSPRVHANGFIQLDITSAIRLHIWGDPRVPRRTDGGAIHDHTYNFTSKVLIGQVRQVTYRLEPLAPEHEFDPTAIIVQPHIAQARQGHDSRLVSVGVPCAVVPDQHLLVDAGTTYAMQRGEIHMTEPMQPSVTVIVKDGKSLAQGGKPPRVFVPQSSRVDDRFDRHTALTMDEMWAIIGDVLSPAAETVATGLLWAYCVERQLIDVRLLEITDRLDRLEDTMGV